METAYRAGSGPVRPARDTGPGMARTSPKACASARLGQRWVLWLAGALALAGLASARLPFAEGEPILAWRGGEVWGHAWSWWWRGLALPEWPARTALLPVALERAAIDPLLAAVFGAASRAVGILAAWNLAQVLAVAGAFLGGAWAARRAGGHPWIGGLTLALGPVFAGSVASGLTEDLALGLLAVVAAMVVVPVPPRPAETDPPILPSWRWVAGVGGGLGVLAWCGPYLALMGSLLALGAGLAALVRRPRQAGRWGAAALLAAALATPAVALLGPRAWSEIRPETSQRVEGPEPLWPLNPWDGADLVSFVAPGPVTPPSGAVVRLHPAYLGIAALALALAAGRSRWWWVLAVPLVLAPGPRLRAGGSPLGVDNPAAWMVDLVPLGNRIHHHGRLMLLGQVALAMLAARGSRRLGTRFGRPVAPIAAGAVLLDYALLSPLPWPLPVADASAPDVLAAIGDLPPGPLVWVPAAGPGIHPQRALLDQRVHGRSLLVDPDRPGPPPARSDTGRWVASSRDAWMAVDPPDLCALGQEGWAVIAGTPSEVARLEPVLGAPHVAGAEGGAWDVRRLCPSAPEIRSVPETLPP